MQLLKPLLLESKLCDKRCHRTEKPENRNQRVAPHSWQLEKAMHSHEDSAQPQELKKKKKTESASAHLWSPSSILHQTVFSFLPPFPFRGGAPKPRGLQRSHRLHQAALGFSRQPLADLQHMSPCALPLSRSHTCAVLRPPISRTLMGLYLFRRPWVAFWVDLRWERSLVCGQKSSGICWPLQREEPCLKSLRVLGGRAMWLSEGSRVENEMEKGFRTRDQPTGGWWAARLC